MPRAKMSSRTRKKRVKENRFYYNCALNNCTNTTLNCNLTFFSLPLEGRRRKLWLETIQREDLLGKSAQHARICEIHFDPSSLLVSPNRKVLKKDSVPLCVRPEKMYLTKETQTTEDCENNDSDYTMQVAVKAEPLDVDEPLEQRRCRWHPLQDHNYTLISEKSDKCSNSKHDKASKTNADLNDDVFFQLCDKFLSKNLADVVKEQKKYKIHSSGNRYSVEYKIFCLRLFYTSPKAYDLLRDTLSLPGKTSLKQMKMPLTTGLHNSLMEVLKTKVELLPHMERNCLLILDVVDINENFYYNIKEDKIYGFHDVDGIQSPEPAKEALVAMVRGISDQYKQLIAYALLGDCRTSDNVAEWIDTLIQNLYDIGLNVRAVVSSLTADFVEITMKRSITIETPYFFVENRKVFVFFDPSNLMLMVRDSLMNNVFQFQHNTVEEAKWKYIYNFYKKDKIKELKIAPKLTDGHVKPNRNQKHIMEFAVQLFSYSVAAGMSTYRDFGAIPDSANGTIKLINIMNDLFDFLTSSGTDNRKKIKNAYSAEGYQTAFINEMQEFFYSLKLCNPINGVDTTSEATFISGFQITLQSISDLHAALQTENTEKLTYKYLATKKLNRDCFKSFLSEVRLTTPTTKAHSVAPTSWHLAKEFRKFVFTSDLKTCKTTKCIDKLAKILLEGEYLYTKLEQETVREKHYLESPSLYVPLTTDDEIVEIADESPVPAATSTKVKKPKKYEIGLMSSRTSVKKLIVVTTDYNRLQLPKKHLLVYLSKVLLKKCAEQHHECDLFIRYVESHKSVVEEETFNRYKAYCTDGGKPLEIMPPDKFVFFVEELEIAFRKFFEQKHIEGQVVKTLLENTKYNTFSRPCKCFPMEYCKTLFFRMRIYQTLLNNNRAIKKQTRSRRQKKYPREPESEDEDVYFVKCSLSYK